MLDAAGGVPGVVIAGNGIVEVAEWIAILLVIATAIGFRKIVGQHRWPPLVRILFAVGAGGWLGWQILRATEFSIGGYCMVAFGAFVLLMSLWFVRRCDRAAPSE